MKPGEQSKIRWGRVCAGGQQALVEEEIDRRGGADQSIGGEARPKRGANGVILDAARRHSVGLGGRQGQREGQRHDIF